MTDTLKNQISAFLDDELSAAESELLVRRLCADRELRLAAARYSMIGTAMRGSLAEIRADLSTAIMAEIDKAPELPALAEDTGAGGKNNAWWRPVAGVAVAAGVAAIALIGLQQADPGAAISEPVTLAEAIDPSRNDARNQSSNSYTVPDLPPQQSTVDPRLTKYLVSHSQYATTMARQGMLGFRSVGFVTQQQPGTAPPPDGATNANKALEERR